MALLAETLVDEWLNRQRFFTVRGIKHGVNEIDLLGVRPTPDGILEAWHVEVQVSFRPISYISSIPEKYSDFAKSKTSAKVRPEHIVKDGVDGWVSKKFLSSEKLKTRESAWSGLTWQYKVVHGVVKFPFELEHMRSHGIETIPFHQVLTQLGSGVPGGLKGGAGTDLSDIIEYFYRHAEAPLAPS